MNWSRLSFTERRTIGLICVALVVATFAVFWPIYQNDFINYDDDQYILENVHVLNGLNWADLKWAFTTAHTGYPHPLTWLTHQLDYQVYGSWAGGHHLTSAFIHVLNVVLLFLLFVRMTGGLWQSAFVAAIFALHPLHVESVAWASERKDVLCGLFWILSLHAYVSYAENPRWQNYMRVLVFFVCGLLSKPTIVTLPAVLLLLDYWPLRRAGLEHASVSKWAKLLLEKAPLIALATIFTGSTILAQHFYGGMRSFVALPWSVRIANAFVSYVQYLLNTIWPAKLAVFYPYAPPSLGDVVIAALALGAITLVVLTFIKRCPYLAIGWFWYLGTLVPVIGILQFGDQALADRYMYVPLIGISIAVAWCVNELTTTWKNRRIILFAAAALVLGACAALAQRQVSFWRNSITLYERAFAVTPINAPLIFDAYTDALMRAGRLKEADAMSAKSRSQFSDNAKRLNLAGSIKFRMNQIGEAEQIWKRALGVNPDGYDTHNNLGILYAKQEQWAKARFHFERLIQLRPNDVVALGNLAQLCFLTKDYANAVRYSRQGLAISPNDPVLLKIKANSERQQWDQP